MRIKKVVFRVDASSSIGLGHLIRCLALAEMIIEDFECWFAIVLPSPEITAQINLINAKVIYLSDELIESFTNEIIGNEIVVLDGYNFNETHQIKIKEKKCKLVFIDDLNLQHFFADVVINHNLTADASKYVTERNTLVCVGSEYILLRKEFLALFDTNNFKTNPFSKVLVCLGGSDKDNLSYILGTLLSRMHNIVEINILVGSAYVLNINELKNISRKIHVYQNLSAKKVVDLMRENNFAIVSASGVAYECASMNMPFIVGYYLEHQILFYEALIKQKNIIGLGEFSNLKLDKLDNLILKLKSNYNPNAISFIDKKQKEKYLHIFNNLFLN